MSTEVVWHHPFWVTFKGRAAACVEAPTEADARTAAAAITGAEVVAVKRIPYAATPRLSPFSHPKYGVMPAFCFRPEQCRGTSCPQRLSCTE